MLYARAISGAIVGSAVVATVPSACVPISGSTIQVRLVRASPRGVADRSQGSVMARKKALELIGGRLPTGMAERHRSAGLHAALVPVLHEAAHQDQLDAQALR